MEIFSALLAICAGNWPASVNSPHKGQWRAVLLYSLICVWINDWVNNREAGDLRRYCAHYDVTVMNRFVLNIEMSGILCLWIKVSGDNLTKAYGVTIRRCRKSHTKIKSHYSAHFVVYQFKTRYNLKFHKNWNHTRQNMHFTRCLNFDKLWYLRVMTPKILLRRPMEYDSVVHTGDDLCGNTKKHFYEDIFSFWYFGYDDRCEWFNALTWIMHMKSHN